MHRPDWLSKPFCLIVMSQAICLALGLWIHHRFIVAAAEWSVEQSLGAELATDAGRLAAALQGLPLERLVPGTEAFERGSAAVSHRPEPARSGVVVVDNQWRLVLEDENGRPPDPPQWKRGETVAWHPMTFVDRSAPERIHGRLQTRQGPRLAAGCRLAGGNGYVLVYSTIAEVKPSAATLLGSLPAAGGLAFVWVCVLQSIVAYMILSRIRREQSRNQTRSVEETLRRSKDLVRARDAVIFGMAKLAESRDQETGHHLEKISFYATRLAAALRRHPKFRQAVTPAFIELIGISSALHDIGKVGIGDAILRKKGKLTDAERVQMQAHTIIGAECLRKIELRLGTSNFLEMAREIALCHHERWDGKGYPTGMAGEQIPLAARIVAIVDVYDALSGKRVYKEPLPHDECVAYVRSHRGKHFDPELVDVFLEIEPQLGEIARKFMMVDRVEPTWKPAEPEVMADRQQDVLVASAT